MSNIPMTRPDDILASRVYPTSPSTSYVELNDGRVLRVNQSEFRVSDDGAMSWSDPFECTDADGDQISGNSLVNLSGDGVGLVGRGRDSEQSLSFWISKDSGETWGSPVRINPPGSSAHALHDVALRTSSGRIVLPVYVMFGSNDASLAMNAPTGKLVNGHWVRVTGHYFDPRFSGSVLYYSDDDGVTWQKNRDGELVINLDQNAVYSYTNEPSVAELSPGNLVMFQRTGLGRLYNSWSSDNGETWTRPSPTSLASSTTPAQIRTMPNGHLLVIWNQHSVEEIRKALTRNRLSTAVSRNGGSVWEFFQNLESILEETRLEPGPIQRVGPEEYNWGPGTPSPERDPSYVETTDETYGVWTYPSVMVLKDRVIVSYRYFRYEEHPTQAKLLRSNPNEREGLIDPGFIEKEKVLPLSWFYGGKEPTDNLNLARS